MAQGKADLPQYKITGTGSCVGGKHPDPPLDGHPLLAWMVAHPRHGSGVFLEDQSASVHDVALAVAETPDLEAVAARFGTSKAHVLQAIDYALAAKLIGL